MPPPTTAVPEPDATLEPDGFTVTVDAGDRIHFLDWGRPATGDPAARGVVLIHGLGQTAWLWAPVARRIGGPARSLHVVAMDIRGHGLSDAPTEDGAYDLAALAGDVDAVVEGSGVGDGPPRPASSPAAGSAGVVLAGHGFGAIVAAAAAVELGDRCAGLVLVDGGWESLEAATGVDVDEFLRGLDEPPEVMRSPTAFLADRRAFDAATWDEDQEHAARATIVETHAGRVVPATRPHALEACVRTMFDYDPITTLAAVQAPIVALLATDDEERSRTHALQAASAAREGAGREPIELLTVGPAGHNLMRYRPVEVAAAILAI